MVQIRRTSQYLQLQEIKYLKIQIKTYKVGVIVHLHKLLIENVLIISYKNISTIIYK